MGRLSRFIHFFTENTRGRKPPVSGDWYTVSGPVVSFTTQSPAPVQSLNVSIDPVQSGSGDPSPDNVRPISGWTGAKVNRTGLNLLDENSLLLNNWNKYGIPNTLKPSTTYRFSVFGETTFSYRLYMTSVATASGGVDVSLNSNYQSSGHSQTFTTPANMEAYPYLKVGASGRGGGLDTTAHLQISVGTAVTDYEPYTGSVIPVSFGDAGTVYGGTLDVLSGVLTVERANIASYAGETLPGEWISDRDVYSPGATPTTGAQVVYKLAAPLTYQLSPTEVTTLPGENYIWADTGDVEVTYFGAPQAPEPEESTRSALNILLGGAYRNMETQDDVDDEEALMILLGGER